MLGIREGGKTGDGKRMAGKKALLHKAILDGS
jgi:hypothetical protein